MRKAKVYMHDKWAGILIEDENGYHNRILMNHLVSLNHFYKFVSIHPFQGGNGRLSRILTTLLLLKTGYIKHGRL